MRIRGRRPGGRVVVRRLGSGGTGGMHDASQTLGLAKTWFDLAGRVAGFPKGNEQG